MLPLDLLSIAVDAKGSVAITASPVLLALGLLLVLLCFLLRFRRFRRYRLVKLNIALGGIGQAEFSPNDDDIQIAHRIWTELVTRKAALPVDLAHDVLTEIYDSWFALFSRTRQLVSDIPARRVREERSTQELVRIATDALNLGLRPHLTRWHARYRAWYQQQTEALKTQSPQEVPLRRFVWPSQGMSESSSTVAAVGIGPRHGFAPAPEADSGRFPRLQPAGVLCG